MLDNIYYQEYIIREEYTMCQMYAESHALGMWSSTNHNTATRKLAIWCCGNVVTCMEERERGWLKTLTFKP